MNSFYFFQRFLFKILQGFDKELSGFKNFQDITHRIPLSIPSRISSVISPDMQKCLQKLIPKLLK